MFNLELVGDTWFLDCNDGTSVALNSYELGQLKDLITAALQDNDISTKENASEYDR